VEALKVHICSCSGNNITLHTIFAQIISTRYTNPVNRPK
jgi:hypothetical protein